MTEDEIRLLSDIFSGVPAKPAPSISEVPVIGRSIAQQEMQDILRARAGARQLAMDREFASRPIPEKLSGAAESAGFIGSTVGRSLGYPFVELYGRATDQPKLGQTFLEGAKLPESDLGLEYTIRFGEAMEPVAKALEASKIPEITPGMLTAPVRVIDEAAAQAARAAARVSQQATQRLSRMPIKQDLLPLKPFNIPDAPQQPKVEKAPKVVPPAPEIQFPAQNEMGFYSPAEQAVLNLRQERGTGDQLLAQISKTAGVRPEELEWTGLNNFLRGKKSVTKAEIQDYLQANKVDVHEVRLGEMSPEQSLARDNVSNRYREITDLMADTRQKFGEGLLSTQEARDILEPLYAERSDLDKTINQLNSNIHTKFGTPDLVLPGGENYREILLTLPSQDQRVEKMVGAARLTAEETDKFRELETLFRRGEANQSQIDELNRLEQRVQDSQSAWADARVRDGQKDFVSTHFDQPNILAHMRINDRTDADGNKVLFVEELQSDWAQQGRKKGFAEKTNPAEMEKKLAEYEALKLKKDKLETIIVLGHDIDPRVQNARREVGEINRQLVGVNDELSKLRQTVPSAPFIKNTEDWVNLSLKRLITEAVNKGYDKVAFINGGQSADRYDLSKHIDSIELRPNETGQVKAYPYFMTAYDKKGNVVLDDAVKENEIENYVGKEVAQRILDTDPNYMGLKVLTGADLRIGGEGMIKFYDQIVPNTANKLLKKLGGGKLEPMQLESGEQLGFTITPKMRELVKGQGVPMFAKGGAIKAAVRAGERAKEGQRMLQGVYRGYTGERLEDPVLSTTPQRRVAEYYANRRATERGEDPHIEMLMVDPFVGRDYGLALPIDKFNREVVTTKAKAISPEDVEGRTQLKKKGGLACL